jgi:uncharacterized protein (DUF1800 family)
MIRYDFRLLTRSLVSNASRFLHLGLGALLVGGCAQQTVAAKYGIILPQSSAARDLTADQQVKQALARLTFGARPDEISRIGPDGLDRWLLGQLEPEKTNDFSCDSLVSTFSTQHMTVKELADSFPSQDIFIRELRRQRGLAPNASFVLSADDSARMKSLNDRGNRVAQQIIAAKMTRAIFSERQLLEIMTDFWENHFSVYYGKMPTRFSLLEYDRDVIRPRALGKFRDLLGAVARSPEMLYYLDNWQSQADSVHDNLGELTNLKKAKTEQDSARIRAAVLKRRQGLNENYGRELLELHTLGVDGGYTQQDVINVARALTGWTVDDPRAGGGFVFRPAMHDASPKLVLGHQLPGGRGIEDGEEVLDIVARHPSTARFIARKLVRHLVSDSVPTSLVDRAAAAFTRTDGDIRQVLATIVTSPEFYSRAAYRAKVKTPFELVVSTMRAMDQLPDTTPRTAQLPSRLGQPVFGRLTPDGWPDDAQEWINSGAVLNRINFGTIAANGGLPGVTIDRWPPAASLRTAPFAEQVDGVIGELLGGEVSPETRSILLSGVNPLAGAMPASNTADANAPRRLKDLIGLTLGAPEFQRR